MKASIFFAAVIFFAGNALAQSWKLESNDNGIKTYSLSKKGSPIIGFKGEGLVDLPFAEVLKTIKDTDNYPQWVPLVVGTRVLKENSSLSRVVYLHVDLPWPVTDRYFVNQGDLKPIEGGGYRMDIRSLPWKIENESKVEGWTSQSYFKISPVEGGKKTAMIVELHQDPKGTVPAFLVNWVQSSWPREFFENLASYKARNAH